MKLEFTASPDKIVYLEPSTIIKGGITITVRVVESTKDGYTKSIETKCHVFGQEFRDGVDALNKICRKRLPKEDR